MKKFYGLLLLAFIIGQQAFGSHILGGEITYRYLGSNGPVDKPFRYQIRFVGYVDRVGDPSDPSNWGCGNLGANPQLAIYDASNNTRIPRFANSPNYPLPSHGPNIQGICPIDPYYGSVRPVIIKKPVSCVVPGLDQLSIAITDTTFIVELPFSASGYKIRYENCCRSQATTNINFGNPGGQDDPGNTWLAEIPSPIFSNSSPQFLEDAVPFFCNGDTATIANNASDPDGDRLIYSFTTPFDGGLTNQPGNTYTPPGFATFNAGYSTTAPFGPSGYAFINPSTGLTKYYSNVNGQFAVAIEIQEYRTLSNGIEILISSTRREFLIVVKDCAPNPAPNPITPPEVSAGGIITVTEGDSVRFDISSNDVDTTTISVISDLITGENGFDGSLASCPSVTGVGLVKTRFRWKADCGLTDGQVRSYPVNVKYEDKGCPPKINNVIYTIVVNPFKAPTISGKDSVCSTNPTYPFSVVPGAGRKWKVNGGSIVGIDTTSNVNISFPGDSARLWLVVTSGLGCKDSTSRLVKKFQNVPITVSAPSIFVCQDSVIQLQATGGFTTVSWNPVAGLSASTIRNPVATISDSTKYYVTSNGPGGCVAKDSIQLNWVPGVASAGLDSILCSGLSRFIGATQPSGYQYYSYSWSPLTGVVSDTSMTTQVNLSNPGSSIQNFVFVQTATHRESGCATTDTVTLAVKPLPVVNAGLDTVTICSGASIILGTIDTTSSVFQWSPVEGLTSPTQDTTSASLININPDPSFTKFVLTKTELILVPQPGEPICSNTDSIVLRVNPLPDFILASNDSICSGFSTEIGTDFAPGFGYQWSPSDGLSTPDSSRTVVTWVNNGPAPIDSVYKLTVTNLSTSCTNSKDLIFRINPLPEINAGLDTSLCSGDTLQIGEIPQAGFSYSWSPTASVLDTAAGNPFITLINPNTGGANQTVEIKVVKVNNQTTCRNFDSLLVTVKPLPLVNASDLDTVTICSRGNIQLGGIGLPNHGYLWSPDSALTDSVSSNPVVSITNPTQEVLYFPYNLQATNFLTSCKNSDGVVIRVNPLPIVPLVYADTAVCSRDTIRIGGASFTGYEYAWTPNLILSDTSSSLPYFTTINNSDDSLTFTYNLLVTNSETGCQENKNVNVVVNPLPDANAGPDLEVCSKDSIQIGLPPVAGRRYLWSPITGLSDPTVSNPKLYLENSGTSPLTFTYTLSVFDMTKSTQCDSTDQMVITVKPLPNAVAAASDTVTTCATVEIQLGITPDPSLNYVWSPALNLSDDSISNPVALINSGNENAPSLYVLTVQDPSTSCKKQDSVYVKVFSLPVVQLGTNDSLCSGDTIQIGSATGLVGPQYQWTPSLGLVTPGNFNSQLTLINSTQNVVVSPYQLLVTNPVTGCKDSATLSVRVNPLPLINAGLDTTVCSTSPANLGVDAPVLGYTYNWTANPGLNFNNIANPQFNATAIGATRKDTLYLLVTNSQTQCKSRDEVVVTTNPRPVQPVFGLYSPTVCPFSANIPYSITNSEPGQTYTWSATGGTIQSGGNTNSINITWGGPSTSAEVRVLPINEFGCTGPADSIAITLNQNLNPPKPLGDSVLCSYAKTGIIYSTIPTPGSNYTWKLLGASVDSTVTSNGQTSVDWIINDGIAKIWIQQQSNTIDPITLTPVQCYGKSDTLKVRINPSPDSTLAISGQVSVCSNSTKIETYNLAGFSGSNYSWTVQPEVSISSGQGTSTISVDWQNPGSYTIGVLETSDKGCIGRPITKLVSVNPVPTPSLANNPDLSVCPGDNNKSYSAQPTPGFENSTFSWKVIGGIALTDTTQSLLGVQWGEAGPYSLVLRETSSVGCFKDSLITLNYDPSSMILTNVSLLELDENQVELKFNMTSQETNNSTISVWRKELESPESTWTTIATVIPKNTTNYIDQPGSTSTKAYQYKVSSANQCARTIESVVHNTILLTGMAHEEDEMAHLVWNPYKLWSNGVSSYELLRKVDSEISFSSFDNGIPDGVKIEKEYMSAGDGFKQCFRVVGAENQGSERSLSNSVCLNFENKLVFYNLITPNGDKKNDTWFIKNLSLYPENELIIHDRWGRKVFSATNYKDSDLWDATGITEGVYFYKFTVANRSLEYNGWIQVTK